MKPQLRIFFVAVFLVGLISGAQAQQAGALAGAAREGLLSSAAPSPPFVASTMSLIDSTYRTTIFTFGNVAVFSYFDGTDVSVLSGSNVIQSWHMNADTIGTYSTSSGVYRIVGNKPFTVLTGDAITNYVNGYFAMDASGLGVSTKFNTWMMYSASSTYDPHFIVFGYKDGTQFTIRNLTTKAVIATGALNAGQYYDFPNVSSISNTPLQVTSNLPVSVLSYTDQDYYVPSSNGTWTGNLFYGFSGYSGSWANSITTVSYENNNQVTVTNLATGALIKSYILNEGQVYCDTIRSDVFWKVSSTGTLAVANIPYGSWSGSYAYMARSTDRSGRNVGTLFYVPTVSSRLDVFSFDDNNFVRITRLGLFTGYPYTSPVVADSAILNAGGVRTISSTSYGSYVYKVEATKNVSVLQSNSSAGADFMPLNFALQLPDLAITSADITFNPPDSMYVAGDKIKVSVKVTNQGAEIATNVLVYAFEGDPDAGGIAPLVASGNLASIPAGGNGTISFDYIIPPRPEYKQLVIKVDPLNTVLESNESNNKAIRPLKPNMDVQPPIAVNITAPNGLLIDSLGTSLRPNPFMVQADLFNTGTVTALNVRVVLTLNNGLTLSSGPLDTTLGNMAASSSAKIVWFIRASKDSTGLNLYSLRITADNAPAKDIRRAINVPDIVPPLAPTGLTLTGQVGGVFPLNWNANTEKDLAGYRIYYSLDDSIGWNGTGANEGNSPVIVSKVTSSRISGLMLRVKYRFAIRAFDYSNNLSPFSNVVSGVSDTVGTIPVPKIVSIWDVPGDNGKQVFVKWRLLRPAASSGIKDFAVWYWNRDSLLWVHVVGGIQSLDDTVFSTIAPTVFDSTKARGMYWSVFRVSAHGVLPFQYTVSPRDSGYSLDNIFPAVPTGVSGTTNGRDLIVLTWRPVPENDLQYYKVYRGTVPGFVVNNSTLIKKVSDTTFSDIGLVSGSTYYYRIVSVDYSGNESAPSPEFSLKVMAVKDQATLPTEYGLDQNYPNPFNPSTTIRFALPTRSFVVLEVINTLGQTVATLFRAEKEAGYHDVIWNASASSGTYFFRIRATALDNSNNTFFKVRKMVLMK